MRLLILTIIFLFFNISGNDAEETLPNPLFEMDIHCYVLKDSSNLKSGAADLEEITTDSIKKIDLGDKKYTALFFHGFVDGGLSEQIRNVSSAYKQMCKNCSVILVAWPVTNDYNQTAKMVPGTGRRGAENYDILLKMGWIKGPFIFVGIGMGAHLAGVVAQNIKRTEVARIVGLDPPSKIFSDYKDTDRLSKTSAKVVHIVHTYLWTDPPSKQFFGHVDFYPNGGRVQPTCRSPRDEKCNRLMAVDYYVEAILKPDSFLGVRCRDYGQFYSGMCSKDIASMGTMAPDGDNLVSGRYYMVTNRKGPPHGLGKRGLKPDWWPTKTGENEDKPGFFKRIWLFFRNIFG